MINCIIEFLARNKFIINYFNRSSVRSFVKLRTSSEAPRKMNGVFFSTIIIFLRRLPSLACGRYGTCLSIPDLSDTQVIV